MTVNTPSVLAFDFVEVYVGNAYHAAHFYQTSFGLEPQWQSGIDTGARDAASVLLGQRGLRLVVTSDLRSGRVADYVRRHGDSVRDVAFLVDDVDAVYRRAVAAGAAGIVEPHAIGQGDVCMRTATVGTPEDLVHTLIERSPGCPLFLAGGTPIGRTDAPPRPSFQSLDHVAIAVRQGELQAWVDYYRDAFDFVVTREERTETRLSAMRSMVVENARGTVKFPILEPQEGGERSQIDEFLSYHDGPGVQHLALLCDDICSAIPLLRAGNVKFLRVPDAYYEALPAHIGGSGVQRAAFREMQVLVDCDETGTLIQSFSRPVTGRPTLFFELVQRDGARGFGTRNIRALFEAVEREQHARIAGV